MKIFIAVLLALLSNVSIRPTDGLANREHLDPEGKVMLDWEYDEESDSIAFKLEAETTGYVGFGISPQGGMLRADIFIAGVHPNGTTYHGDYVGIGNTLPKLDDHQDWNFINATEGEGKTTVEFSRKRNTCDDDEDYPIGVDTTKVIWAIGSTDNIQFHGDNKGTKSMNLIGEPMPDLNTTGLDRHEMSLEITMPSLDTSYWCSFYEGPELRGKHQIVGFAATLPDLNALKHTHHFILYNCELPVGHNETAEEVFGNFTVGSGFLGGHCSDINPDVPVLPRQYCKVDLFVWAKGGKDMVFPENLGYPIGESGQQSFYMVEIHYDNPEELDGVTFRTGVEFYYTNNLREHDAGLLMVGHLTNLVLTVPPNQTEFVVSAYCTSNCSDWGIEERDGVTVFNVLLHSHVSGRKLKLRHFRGDRELPWLDYDDHYDFDYQQNKPIKPMQLLPGDDLVMECTYDSTWFDGKVVVGGISSRNEMCVAYLWYWPKQDMTQCMSQTSFDGHLANFGIGEGDYHFQDAVGGPILYIDSPAYLRGPYEETINNFNWTPEFIKEFQTSRLNGRQEQICLKESGEFIYYDALFPSDAVEYVPENEDCVQNPTTDETTSGGETTTTTTTPGGEMTSMNPDNTTSSAGAFSTSWFIITYAFSFYKCLS